MELVCSKSPIGSDNHNNPYHSVTVHSYKSSYLNILYKDEPGGQSLQHMISFLALICCLPAQRFEPSGWRRARRTTHGNSASSRSNSWDICNNFLGGNLHNSNIHLIMDRSDLNPPCTVFRINWCDIARYSQSRRLLMFGEFPACHRATVSFISARSCTLSRCLW